MRNKKTIIIGILCVLVVLIAVGYAAFTSELTINGTSSINTTWKVEITNITEKDIVGDAISEEMPSYTGTTVNFSVGLSQPGDSITYDIEVSNLGTLKTKVDSINITMDNNDAIIYKTEGIVKGDTLGVNEKDTLSVTVTYNPEVTSQPINTGKDITVIINYVQDLGTSNEPSITYDYVIGDNIHFAGSNWYVIKNSTTDEDYVTLMKRKILTNAELGEYAVNDTDDAMSYYWSSECHWSGNHGYTNSVESGCEGHNDYEGSKVKEFFDEKYIYTLGETNLKEVEGYKIRLITTEELASNLGWTALDKYATDNDNSNVPSWVYQNFGEENTGIWSYWTMSTYGDSLTRLYIVSSSLTDQTIINRWAVRPVINLLKSSME